MIVASRRRRHDAARGQSLVEMAIVLPVMMALFLGAVTAAELIADNDTAGQAVRTAARVAAEVGNNGYPNTSPLAACQAGVMANPCAVDQKIIGAMLPVLTGKLTNVTLTELDIYKPAACPDPANLTNCDGRYRGSGPVDRFTATGVPIASAGYTLDLRNQLHPNEVSVGVMVKFHYTSPTMAMFTMDQAQYAVIRLAPKFS